MNMCVRRRAQFRFVSGAAPTQLRRAIARVISRPKQHLHSAFGDNECRKRFIDRLQQFQLRSRMERCFGIESESEWNRNGIGMESEWNRIRVKMGTI